MGLTDLVRGADWAKMSQLVSPSFFEVLPPKALSKQLAELTANRLSRGKFSRAKAACRASLAGTHLKISLLDGRSRDARLDQNAEERGETVLALFFHQIFSLPVAVIDLGSESFSRQEDGWAWSPKAMYCEWDPAFLSAIRRMYSGFFEENDDLFREGLSALKLAAAEEQFRLQFGANRHRARFSLREFQDTFHHVFVECRKAHIELHPNFLPLGLYLASLYQHLEQLGVELDVSRAYERARGT